MNLDKLLNSSVPQCINLNMGFIIIPLFGRNSAMCGPKPTKTSYSFLEGTQETSSPSPLRDGQGQVTSSGPGGGVQVTISHFGLTK